MIVSRITGSCSVLQINTMTMNGHFSKADLGAHGRAAEYRERLAYTVVRLLSVRL